MISPINFNQTPINPNQPIPRLDTIQSQSQYPSTIIFTPHSMMSGSCEMPPGIDQIDHEISYIGNNCSISTNNGIPGENMIPDFSNNI